jgi:tRNA threonylcarbamoyladenosine biosynthesis protein TsaE
MTEHYQCKSPDELPAIAKILIDKYPQSRIFAFYGEMGAGKTTFIKAICTQLQVIDTVSSPTFAIVNEYMIEQGGRVFHFDLYRLKSWTEMLEIGYEDYFFSGNYCLLEWPEKIVNLLPDDTIRVTIEASADNSERTISF